MRNRFIKFYIDNPSHLSGKCLAKSSINCYAGTINTVSKMMLARGIISANFYDFTDLDELEKAYSEIIESDGFYSDNKKQHSRASCALRLYIHFRKEEQRL